jgi:hypothetical protein
MFNRVCQRSSLVAAFIGAMVLAAGLPAEQFIDLARLTIQVGISFSIACLIVFVAPGLIGSDWFKGVLLSVRALRLAQGWIPSRQPEILSATPRGVASVLLRPPRSIS